MAGEGFIPRGSFWTVRKACIALIASVGMLLRDSEIKGDSSYNGALEWAKGALGEDEGGYRREFVKLVELVRVL